MYIILERIIYISRKMTARDEKGAGNSSTSTQKCDEVAVKKG